MDWSLFPQLLFWSVLAILSFVGFIFMARLVAPDWHRQMFQVFEGWASRWRAWRDPEGERRRRLWQKYQEVKQYLRDFKMLEESIGKARSVDPAEAETQAEQIVARQSGRPRDPSDRQVLELFLRLAAGFDMKAARKLTEDETVPFFENLEEPDAVALAVYIKLTPEFKNFHVPGASIVDFLMLEKRRIRQNRHLVCQHLDRLDTFMREEEKTCSQVSQAVQQFEGETTPSGQAKRSAE